MRSTDRFTFAAISLLGVMAVATVSLTFVPALGDLVGRTPAAPPYGEAVIEPIESNVAAKPWASVASSSHAGSAALAVDEEVGTAWIAEGPPAGEWLSVDLGGAYDNIRKVEVVFPDPAAAYRYVIEASSEGEAWDVIHDASADGNASGGAVALLTRPGTRYVRVTFDASSGADVGISEIRAFNYLREEIVLGADLSWVDNFQDREYWVHPLEDDLGAGPHLLDVVQDRGMEYIRLRIWNEPRNERTGEPVDPPRQGPERSLTSARWIVERGLGLGVDFHYADSWADPGKQPKPRAWAELPFDELVEAVYAFTADYLGRLIEQGTTPAKVAVGNEIINGFLWGSEASGVTDPSYFADQAEIYQSRPGGALLWDYWDSDDPGEGRLYDEAWDRFATLVASGVRAVRDASPTSKVEIHVVVDDGELDKTMEFWDQLLARLNDQGQDADILAISYYPEWHGTIEDLERNLYTIATTYPDYQVAVSETSYPASGDDGDPMPNATFPRTVQGQADALQRVFQAANDVVNNKAVAVLTWEPASWQAMFRQVPGLEETWEPHASIDVYNKSHAAYVVQDRVYATVVAGEAVRLPATVRVLTTADGAVDEVPIEWDEVPAGATARPGEVTIEGVTEFGEVSAIVSVVDELRDLVAEPVGVGPLPR